MMLDKHIWQGITKKNQNFFIKFKEYEDKYLFNQFLSDLPFGIDYPENTELSSTDMMPGEFRTAQHHLCVWIQINQNPDKIFSIVGELSIHPGSPDKHNQHQCKFHEYIIKKYQ